MATDWQASYSHEDFAIVEETVSYDGHFRVLDQKLRFQMFSGSSSPIVARAKMDKGPAVVVLLYHPEQDAVLLVEQFRIGAVGHAVDIASPWLLEPVCGLIEFNDTPTATAKREVLEETGCQLLELIPICKYLASPGMSNEMAYVMCGRINTCQLEITHGVLSESEDIKVHLLPVSVAFKLLETNKIIAASGIIALQWLQLNINMVRARWKSQP